MDDLTSVGTLPIACNSRLHVACIMDGNGRWASARNIPRQAGHHAGVEALRNIVIAAPEIGIGVLTVYAFSSDNWRRPASEVANLIDLFRKYLDTETEALVRDGVRLTIVGRRDRFPSDVIAEIERSEAATQWGDALHLQIAMDYSSRDSILAAVAAAAKIPAGTKEQFGELLSGGLAHANVDLLVRTGGEQRLSNFLLWECAYAELHFSKRLWPDFTKADLAEAVTDFRERERRFGGLSTKAA
jgi:undecaprenyl diphosphate synthase